MEHEHFKGVPRIPYLGFYNRDKVFVKWCICYGKKLKTFQVETLSSKPKRCTYIVKDI